MSLNIKVPLASVDGQLLPAEVLHTVHVAYEYTALAGVGRAE